MFERESKKDNNEQKDFKSDFESYVDKKFDEMSEIIDTNNDNHIRKIEELKSINQDQIAKVDKAINGLTAGLNKLLSDMRIELEDVKNIANEKESRIIRYEDGYDYKILKDFTKELIRITEYADTNKHKDSRVGDIYEDLTILLENEGVEKIGLAEGDKYTGNEKIAKIIDTQSTHDEEMDNIIKEIVKNGYSIYITEDKQKIIKPTEVVIYRYKDIEHKISDKKTEQVNIEIDEFDNEPSIDSVKNDSEDESSSINDKDMNRENISTQDPGSDNDNIDSHDNITNDADNNAQDDSLDFADEDVVKESETLPSTNIENK